MRRAVRRSLLMERDMHDRDMHDRGVGVSD